MPVVHPLDMKYVQKPWGWECWICNGPKYCGKKLFIKAGHWLSYHHHKLKDEVLFVESGRIWFTHDEQGIPHSFELGPGRAFHVVPGVKHQMQAIEDATLFEFSTQHFDEDSIRTTRELVIDHGDNGMPIRTYVERPEPPKPEPINFIPPNINFDKTPSWEKDDVIV